MTETVQLRPVASSMTLAERVYVTIKEAILELRLKPGTPLVEDDLARQLGTSKTPVRDALMALERDGLVEKIPYKGTHVADVTLRDAREIFELRAVLEGLAARQATLVIKRQEVAEAERLLDLADAALARGDLNAASDYGNQFHRLLHERADNRRLMPILEGLEEQFARIRRMSASVSGRLQKSADEHRGVLAALHTGDPAQVEHAMRHHMESVIDDFRLAPAAAAAHPLPQTQPEKETLS
jgi:DNA-binding GntR family transcriptional regulator